MNVIVARNPHQALAEACHKIRTFGVRRESRNGPVIRFETPLTTYFHKPMERVVFWPERDANPFFHLFEALWMLAGRNDVAYPLQFNSKFGAYSDDGETFNAAYGFRWRHHFGGDQLQRIVMALKANPDCRRQVLSMWDGNHDLGLQSKDLPCNTQAYFQRASDGSLDMMVSNRSNDMIWGAYGANAVHFAFLLEYMAAAIGCSPGQYWQVSFNTHLYLKEHEVMMNQLAERAPMPPSQWAGCPYTNGTVRPYPLCSLPHSRWMRELDLFMKSGTESHYSDPFFEDVARPMLAAYQEFKSGGPSRHQRAKNMLTACVAHDWQLAGTQWLERKEIAWKLKNSS